MAKLLTARQREIFTYIQQRIKEGYPPTIREIGSKFGFSEKAAHDHLNALEKKKYIGREEGKPRAISILKEADPQTRNQQMAGRAERKPCLSGSPTRHYRNPDFRTRGCR